MDSKILRKVYAVLSVVIVTQLLLLWIFTTLSSDKFDLGVEAVKAMYQFNTPEELLEGQQYLKSILTEDEFERLCLDNTSRAISAYYKFGYSSSKVNVLEHYDGYVLYTILNTNIPKQHQWVFEYKLTDEGKITDVKEYRLVEYYDSEVLY